MKSYDAVPAECRTTRIAGLPITVAQHSVVWAPLIVPILSRIVLKTHASFCLTMKLRSAIFIVRTAVRKTAIQTIFVPTVVTVYRYKHFIKEQAIWILDYTSRGTMKMTSFLSDFIRFSLMRIRRPSGFVKINQVFCNVYKQLFVLWSKLFK